MSSKSTDNKLVQLHTFIIRHYDLEGVRNLAFRCEINHENLRGDTLNEKARELILFMGNQKRLPSLFRALQESNRPAFDNIGFSTDQEDIEQLYRYLPGLSNPQFRIPFQGPPSPANFIPREQEDSIKMSLISDKNRIILIHGPSGIGKTSLAAGLVEQFKAEGTFPDGILWGDMGEGEAGEQLSRFVHALSENVTIEKVPQNTLLRDIFWDAIVDKQILIVLDNVDKFDRIEELITPELMHSKWNGCRVLLLSIMSQMWINKVNSIHELKPFSKSEAIACFNRILDEQTLRRYEDLLPDIAEYLDYFPNLIAAAAQSFSYGDINPYQYLQQLRQKDEPLQRARKAIWEIHELNIQSLSTDQKWLLDLTAILSRSDFNFEMLAAVALMKPTEVQAKLDEFVKRGLLQQSEMGRYTRNQDFHEFLQHRLEQWPSYELQAAHHLLAYYCLDLAQALILKKPEVFGIHSVSTSEVNDQMVAHFQADLMAELSHIRAILRWAFDNKEWHILRRFSRFPYFGLLQKMYVNSFRTRLSFDMASISHLVVYHHGQKSIFEVQNCIGSEEGLAPDLRPGAYLFILAGDVIGTSQVASDENRLTPSLVREPGPKVAPRLVYGDKIVGILREGIQEVIDEPPIRPELMLNLRASSIDKTLLSKVNLVNCKWYGTRATDLHFKGVDMVSSQFLGCDLRKTGWFDCDARNIDFSDTDLSGSVFRDVDLRGAVLRNTNLSDVVFNNVDLRGSDLRGADFSGVAMKQTNLEDCNWTGTIWKDATGSPLLSDEDRRFTDHLFNTNYVRIEGGPNGITSLATNPIYSIDTRTNFIYHAASFEGNNLIANGSHKSAVIHASRLDGEIVFLSVDLSGATFESSSFSGETYFIQTIMNCWTVAGCSFSGKLGFIQTNLMGALIEKSSFSGNIVFSEVIMTGARISDSSFSDVSKWENFEADMLEITGSSFENISFSQGRMKLLNVIESSLTASKFADVELMAASFEKSNLNQAEFHQADLRRSQWINVNLNQAKLANSNVSFSSMKGVSLIEASLVQVDMSGALLEDVNMQGAKLEETQFGSISLDNVTLLGVDMSQTDWHGDMGRNFVNRQFWAGYGQLKPEMTKDKDFRKLFEQLQKEVISSREMDADSVQKLVNKILEQYPASKHVIFQILLPIVTARGFVLLQNDSGLFVATQVESGGEPDD